MRVETKSHVIHKLKQTMPFDAQLERQTTHKCKKLMEKCNEDLYSVQFIVIILRMGACVQMLKHTYVLKKIWVGGQL